MGCSSHACYDEAMRYMEKVMQVLVEKNLCKSKTDCSRREMVLWSAGAWKLGPLKGGGVQISVYQVSSAETGEAIVTRCRALRPEMPDVPVNIAIYSVAHNQSPGKSNLVAHAEF